MRRMLAFIAKEAVPVIAGALALLSMALTPPSAAYAGYVDVRTLGVLFALMGVVSCLSGRGMLDAAARVILRRATNLRAVCLALVLLCFFASMLVTNDVALMAFVPLAAALLARSAPGWLAYAVAMQAVAANLGSAVTPFGNPQNLYLFSRYALSLPALLQTMLPLAGVSLLAVTLLCLPIPRAPIPPPVAPAAPVRPATWRAPLLLLALCVLAVLRALPWWGAAAAVLAYLLVFDRAALRRVDYALLATFVFFFVFVGNLGAYPPVADWLRGLLTGRETLVSALTSQVVSNVPAALMLSGFTENARGLLLGTNIGGLGTPVASMASLIALRLYSRAPGANAGRFLAVFMPINMLLLAAFIALFSR